MTERYTIITENNSIYIVEKRGNGHFIQKIYPETDKVEYPVKAITKEGKVVESARKNLKSALENASAYFRYAGLEPGAFILYGSGSKGGCTSKIRFVEKVALAA